MAKLEIKGGRPLRGDVAVQGAKNAILPIMAAGLLTPQACLVERVAPLRDVLMMGEVLRHLQGRVELEPSGILHLEAGHVEPRAVPPLLMRQLRASNLVMGPLLARYHYACVAYPGGCDIGSRPMDLHLKGFMALGAEVREEHGFIEVRAVKLKGADIQLDFPSVGATENLMLAAVLAEGTTLLRNAAKEPEIVDLQNFLNALGARVKGAGLDTIRIEGVAELRGARYQVIPDRIEAGTHLLAGCITGGEVRVAEIIPEHLEALLAKLREAGVQVEVGGNWVRVKARGRPTAVDIKTLPYPGFPTDLQPPIMSLLCLAQGTSIVTENIFESRFKHVGELRRLGALVRVEGRSAVVTGVSALSGAVVEARDLRAAAGLVLAGLAAENTTVVENVEYLDRGYAALTEKYCALGAEVRRL